MVENMNSDPFIHCSELDKGFEHYKRMEYSKAIEIWEPLCEKADPKENNPYAQYMIAEMMENKLGYVETDSAKCFSLYKKSAEAGHQKGQNRLGQIFYYGFLKVKQDFKEGVRWYKLASAQGDNQAHFFLGCAYYDGLGVERNNILSYAWHYIASIGGIDASHEICKTLEKIMSPEEIFKAKHCGSKLFRKIYQNFKINIRE